MIEHGRAAAAMIGANNVIHRSGDPAPSQSDDHSSRRGDCSCSAYYAYDKILVAIGQP